LGLGALKVEAPGGVKPGLPREQASAHRIERRPIRSMNLGPAYGNCL